MAKVADSRAKELIKIGNKMFSDKAPVDSLWQEIALNFFPERADFTSERSDGDEFADHLYASYPVMARRELGNMLSAGLRPRAARWFSIHVEDEDLDNGDAERAYLEYITEIQWRAMYDANTGLVRATKQTDHDLVTFGNGVIKYGINAAADGLHYRNYHLRDCVWAEDAEGRVDVMHRNWKPTARQLRQMFGDNISPDVKKAYEKEPEKEFECRHVVVPTRLYDGFKSLNGRKYPFTSFYVECESEKVLEEVGLNYFCYVVPRWQTVANSVFGVSMATAVVLPDGRTMQVVLRTLREAAEKHVDPPMLATFDVIRSDMALYAGGVTTVDRDYDEQKNDAIRPIARDKSGFPIGEQVAEALRADIRSGFFLDKMQLPESQERTTAFEIQRRLEEQVRAQSPIYDPMMEEYSNPLCEGTFNILRDYGAFPPPPPSLDKRDIKFKFRSPLTDLSERAEAESFMYGMNNILLPISQVDPAQLENVELTVATRDALKAVGYKQKWMKPIQVVAKKQAENAQAAMIAKGTEAMMAVGGIAQQAGDAATSLKDGGVDISQLTGGQA